MSIDLNEYTSESQAVSVKPLPSENQPTTKDTLQETYL